MHIMQAAQHAKTTQATQIPPTPSQKLLLPAAPRLPALALPAGATLLWLLPGAGVDAPPLTPAIVVRVDIMLVCGVDPEAARGGAVSLVVKPARAATLDLDVDVVYAESIK